VIAALLALAVALPPAGAGFDYQLGGDYPLPPGVSVVSRDWHYGRAADGAYNDGHVNAFQTQPGERGHWPRGLVLTRLGPDPGWPGEYAVDVSTARKRARAARFVGRWVKRCAAKGYDAVEYDNLDSWTRFDGTPREGDVPFGKSSALAFAALITRRAHALGLAVGQKNTAELTRRQARWRDGFDFAIAEECGRYRECNAYRRVYGDHVIAIEYRRRDFRYTCRTAGDRISVVLRDLDVTAPGSRTYRYDSC
jgi:hypothetical protein